MDNEAQLKLQAYLDGELSGDEAQQMAAVAKGDALARALVEELRQTRQAVKTFEETLVVPASREFYWSKIKREIERQEAMAARRTEAPPWLARWRRLLVPVASLAVIAVVALVAGREVFPRHYTSGLETALEDSGAFTYHNFAAGTTLVWLSYPADNEVAPGDELDTLE